MTSDVMFQSDQKQSIDQAYVDSVILANEGRAARGEDLVPVPEPGKVCPKDKKHGRMLMNKSGLLECGPCGFQVQA